MVRTQQSQTVRRSGHPRVKLSSGQDTAESGCAVVRTPQNQTNRWCEHPRIRLCSGQNPAESDCALVRTPQSQTVQWSGHNEVKLYCLQNSVRYFVKYFNSVEMYLVWVGLMFLLSRYLVVNSYSVDANVIFPQKESLYRFLQYISGSVYTYIILSANAEALRSIYNNLNLDHLLDS